MQAPVPRAATERREAAYNVMGADVRVELPEPLTGRARAALGRWEVRPKPEGAIIRVFAESEGWLVEAERFQARAGTVDAALLRLQEVMLETAAVRRGDRLLFRGSVVARGSQSLLIVGDLGAAHVALAVALTVLEFRLVSVGAAAFDGRRLVPLPLPLVFSLGLAEREALWKLPDTVDDHLERVSSELYRPHTMSPAPEPTHVIFPESHAGRLSLVRPISATRARSRLCRALIAAPEDQSPFAAVAEVMRHTRGVHLTIGDLSGALDQLSRLLPYWNSD